MSRERRTVTALIGRNLRHQARLGAGLIIGFVLFQGLVVQAVAMIEAESGLRDLIAMLPPAFGNFVGTQLAFASYPAAVAFGFQHPIVLVGAVAFIVVLGSTPAGERESGMLDLLLARPMSRSQYLLGTLVPMITGAVLLPLALLLGVIAGQATVNPPGALPWTRYLMSAVGLSALLLALGGMTLLLAAGAQRRGPAVARAVGIVLALYIAEVFADLRPQLELLHWISPFHYYDPIRSAIAGVTPPLNLLVLLLVFAGTTALAFYRFERRDV